MPTDLVQQLSRFAEVLDRDAPAISVDEILSRGPVAVDVNRLVRPTRDEVPLVTAGSGNDAMPDHDMIGDYNAWIELVPTAVRAPVAVSR